jgi:hypothetical protein
VGRIVATEFIQAWPSQEGEFADKFNAMPKYVVSSTLKDPEWNNPTVLRGDLGEAVAKLRQQHGGTWWSMATPSWCRRWSPTTWSTSCA